jgi:hypothetical protein
MEFAVVRRRQTWLISFVFHNYCEFILFILSLFIFAVLEFEFRSCTLSHSTSPFFVMVFCLFVCLFVFEIGSFRTILLRLASNFDLPDLCLLSSWDYRHEPLAPGLQCSFHGVCYGKKKTDLVDFR